MQKMPSCIEKKLTPKELIENEKSKLIMYIYKLLFLKTCIATIR